MLLHGWLLQVQELVAAVATKINVLPVRAVRSCSIRLLQCLTDGRRPNVIWCFSW
jgi:hypothetical protein